MVYIEMVRVFHLPVCFCASRSRMPLGFLSRIDRSRVYDQCSTDSRRSVLGVFSNPNIPRVLHLVPPAQTSVDLLIIIISHDH